MEDGWSVTAFVLIPGAGGAMTGTGTGSSPSFRLEATKASQWRYRPRGAL
jgi:hypothetical protein